MEGNTSYSSSSLLKNGADMTYVAELRAREGNWRLSLLHGVYPALLWIA